MHKLSDLNYKIVDKKGKEFVVHINHLKKSYDQTPGVLKAHIILDRKLDN